MVIDASDYYREYNANVHRGIYRSVSKATAYEEARHGRPVHQRARQHEVVFT